MSKVDDELTRRFHRVERPVDVDGLFEGLERRRSHRERVRRLQAGALAVTVVAASIAGFYALSGLFRTDGTVGGSSQPGRIVFGRVQLTLYADGGSSARDFEIWSMAPGGSDLRLVSASGDGASTPTWSPDGDRIAFLERGHGGNRLFEDRLVTTRPDGSDRRLIADGLVSPPFRAAAWSPDGDQIAVLDTRGEGLGSLDEFGIPITDIALYSTEGVFERFVDVPGAVTGFAWSPNGDELAVVRFEDATTQLVRVDLDGHVVRIVATDVAGSASPAWSPDGSRLAFVRTVRSDGSPEEDVWIANTDGTNAMRITVDGGRKPALTWSPDGTRILYSRQTPDRCDFVSVGADGSGRRIIADRSELGGCMQELSVNPAGSDPAPQPSISPTPEEGRDIGLAFPLCHVEHLTGIDWYGDGTDGSAWTGARETADGRCPVAGAGDHVVASDLDGDGVAEPGGMGFLASCLFCRPYATADLDADGVLELVVLEEASSTPSYSFFEVSVPTSERSPGIYNLLVARPGHPEARILPGEPLRITAGGDEGYSSEIVCEPPVLAWTWALAPVDSQEPSEVHYVELELRAGVFVVVGRNDFTVPAGEPTGTAVTEPSCGVDWHPAA